MGSSAPPKNWFNSVPFMAEGIVQGLIGAGLAVAVVAALQSFGFDHWFTSTTGFFREFYVTGSDATVIGLIVFGLGGHRAHGLGHRPASLPQGLTPGAAARLNGPGLAPRLGAAGPGLGRSRPAAARSTPWHFISERRSSMNSDQDPASPPPLRPRDCSRLALWGPGLGRAPCGPGSSPGCPDRSRRAGPGPRRGADQRR